RSLNVVDFGRRRRAWVMGIAAVAALVFFLPLMRKGTPRPIAAGAPVVAAGTASPAISDRSEIPSTDLPDTTDDVVEEKPSTIASQQVGEHEPIVVPLVVESNTPETGKPAADGVFLVTQIDSDSPAPGGSASAETPPAAHGEKQPAEMNARGEPHVE